MDLSLIKIRKVESADIELLTQHRINYLTELQGERSNEFKTELRDELNAYFRSMIAEGSFMALMGEYKGEAIAFGCMIIKKIPGDMDKSSYLESEILNMYTIPGVRRKGICTIIFKNLLLEAKRMGISKVSLHTTAAGEKIYRKFGFKYPDDYPYMELVLANCNLP